MNLRSRFSLIAISVLLLAVNLGHDANAGKIQETITKPLQDTIALNIPLLLKQNKMAELGFLDVTSQPFGADPTGQTDSTLAIQKAIDFARDNQLVCFFPEGTYLISDTLYCYQYPYNHSKRGISGAPFFPVALVGSKQGARPTIVLAPNSVGFSDQSLPKYVIQFDSFNSHMESEPPINYNQILANINIYIAKGNSGAIALRHRGAQGTSIQECSIDVSNGYIGFEGGLGSGGSIADLTVIGGEFGLFMKETQPTPTITGVTLKDQRKSAIVYGGRQSLSAVGLSITMNNNGPAIVGEPNHQSPHYGEMSLVDCKVVFNGAPGTAIITSRNLFLHNFYAYNAKNIASVSGNDPVHGVENQWICVEKYAATGNEPREVKSYRFTPVIYINGNKSKSLLQFSSNAKPPLDIQSKHLWNPLPHFESSECVNVKHAPYYAKGDGISDDTAALQRAINENKIIFLPKGIYRIKNTLQLNKSTIIFGTAKHLSLLFFDQDFPLSKFQKGVPAVATASGEDATNYVAFLGIFVPIWNTNAYALLWQASNKSILRDVNFYNEPSIPQKKPANNDSPHPNVVVSGGGGKWYNFFQIRYQNKSLYNHLLIKNSISGLSVYQCNLEHVANSSAAEIIDSSNLALYGLKAESLAPYDAPAPIIRAKNTKDLHVYGYGGNARSAANGSLFSFSNCENYELINLVDTPILNNKEHQIDKWWMVSDYRKGILTTTAPLERPALYLWDNTIKH